MLAEDERRRILVREARAWLGTPYHPGADLRGVGVDCGMLLVRVFVDAGLVLAFDPRPYPQDWHLHRDDERYLGFVSDLPPAVASWRDQIERLSEHPSPCRYLLPVKWKAMREDAVAFLDQHGADAHRLGWTAEQLFGVHQQHGFLCVEYAGALMVNDSPAVAVEPDRIVFDRFSAYRTKPGQVSGPPVWEYGAKR